MSSLCSAELDIGAFRTASGEIIPDEGGHHQKGYNEQGHVVTLNGRKSDVHKPLIAGGKMFGKGFIGILTSGGGHVLPNNSWLSHAIMDLIWWYGEQEMALKLYQEKGVYKFYLQNEDYKWVQYNLDTGAAVTVFPRTWGNEKEEETSPNGGQARP